MCQEYEGARIAVETGFQAWKVCRVRDGVLGSLLVPVGRVAQDHSAWEQRGTLLTYGGANWVGTDGGEVGVYVFRDHSEALDVAYGELDMSDGAERGLPVALLPVWVPEGTWMIEGDHGDRESARVGVVRPFTRATVLTRI